MPTFLRTNDRRRRRTNVAAIHGRDGRRGISRRRQAGRGLEVGDGAAKVAAGGGNEGVDDRRGDGDVLVRGDVGEAGGGAGGVEGGEAEFGAAGGEGFDYSGVGCEWVVVGEDRR